MLWSQPEHWEFTRATIGKTFEIVTRLNNYSKMLPNISIISFRVSGLDRETNLSEKANTGAVKPTSDERK